MNGLAAGIDYFLITTIFLSLTLAFILEREWIKVMQIDNKSNHPHAEDFIICHHFGVEFNWHLKSKEHIPLRKYLEDIHVMKRKT